MFRLYRKHLRTLSQLLAGVWLFAIFVSVVGCCLYSAAAPDSSVYHQKTAATQQGSHDHCNGDHAPVPHDDAGCQLDHNLAGLVKFIQSDFSQVGALALIAVLLIHLVLPPVLAPPTTLLGLALTFTGDPPPTIRFHRFNN